MLGGRNGCIVAVLLAAAFGLLWMGGGCHSTRVPVEASPGAQGPVDVASHVWRDDLRDGGEVHFVRKKDMAPDGELSVVAKSSSDLPSISNLSSLGPLDEAALAHCKRRMKGMVDLYERDRLKVLSEPIPEDRALQDAWHEKALKAHYMCLKAELAAKVLDAGDYWVFTPGRRRLPADIRTIEFYGVKALGRDNVTVVVPLSLVEHPQLASMGTDWEEFIRYRARLFAEEFNLRSHADRVAAIARADDLARQLGVWNARSAQEGLTESDLARIEVERAEARRAQFPMYCLVDRDRQLLYVWERGR